MIDEAASRRLASYLGNNGDEVMFDILEKRLLAPNTYWFEVHAPLVCHARKPGQFLILCPHEKAERIPLSLAGGNLANDSVYLVVQAVGKTTREICAMDVGDRFYSILGPLGHPTPIENYGTVACIGGGYGVGALLPIAESLREAGAKVIGIIGAREKSLVLMEDKMRAVSDVTRVCTNDGSLGMKGMVTDALQSLVDEGTRVDHVIAIGPVPMMAALSRMTQSLGIGCTVSLNALMVDGTGMCGGCRVNINGEALFACCDGPDFDGHQVDFDELTARQKWYNEAERKALESYERDTEPHSPACLYKSDLSELERHWNPNVPAGLNLNNGMKPKQRMSIPRQVMPEQSPETRRHNFQEVALGYTEAMAIAESHRCIQCGKPSCVEGCPVGIDIPRFLKLVREGKFVEASQVIHETNALPAICGRVCPQETQCEIRCVLTGKHDPVAIGRLERFVADYARQYGGDTEWTKPTPTGRKVAIIGSGPAGLTVAGDLIERGHEVHVFEALHRLGGVLIYGIPEFRLPNEIVEQEIDALRQKGVEFHLNALIGKAKSIDDLMEREGFDAVFLGTGAGLPRMLGVPGENLKGVYTANEFLTRVNLMHADRFPEYSTPVTVGERAAVIGAGNTAMDAARVCLRLGAREVWIIYRRSVEECPARAEELHHAQEEGVQFQWLTNPAALYGNEEGWLKEIECIRMELGEPDDSGRRSPVPIPGSEFRLPMDTVISALGFGVNPLAPKSTKGLELTKRGAIAADPETGQTSKPGVFAGGDSITGGSTVIQAMGQGRVAARAMHEYLTAVAVRG